MPKTTTSPKLSFKEAPVNYFLEYRRTASIVLHYSRQHEALNPKFNLRHIYSNIYYR
jgi:hypothetical protein